MDSFIRALNEAGATCKIIQTFRPQKRAYLMHYAWQIARAEFDPANVPAFEPSMVPAADPYKGNLDICWLHRDADGEPDLVASRAAAEAMVQAYGMIFPAAYPSNHSARTAIDMEISWTGDLTIVNGDRRPVPITSTPRAGDENTDLHAVGATYGVIKLRGDPPHWSETGG